LLFLCHDSEIYILKITFMCYLPSSIKSQALLYIIHHPQSRLSGDDVIAHYVECGSNHVPIEFGVEEARDLRPVFLTFTFVFTSVENQR
jgi:hypothetical protein